MKRRIGAVGAVLAAGLVLVGCSSGGDASGGGPAENDRLKVATEGTFAPFNYFDDANDLTGFEVELAEALAEKMGVSLEWETASFDSLLLGLQQDRYDFVIASHSITPERQKQVDFADPHYCSGGVLSAVEGAEVPRLDNLQDKRVAAQVGATYLDRVTADTNAKQVDSYPSDAAGLDAMLKGQAEVWVADRFVVKESERARSITLTQGDSVAVEEIGMATKRGSEELLNKLNDALAEALSDGTYQSISEKWFDEDIRCES